VEHPKIHVNCVLTKKNLDDFPALFRFMMGRKKNRHNARDESARKNLLSDEMGIHAIPVGGAENTALRPSQEEYYRFFTVVWAETCRIWDDIQAEAGIPPDQRRPMANQFYISNPFLRVSYQGTLEDYTFLAGQGIYSKLASTRRCYVAPTQAFLLPDGSQHWCGAHVAARPAPLGSALRDTLSDNIKANIAAMQTTPSDFCRNCATATVGINQRTEGALKDLIEEWVKQEGDV